MQPLICPEPVRRPVMVQRWNDVVFLHWRELFLPWREHLVFLL